MKVSVITPSYNQGQFLEETLRSVLSQTHPDVELLVLDGGSTDGSVDILERYKDRLWYRSKEDDGQTAAINEGFHRATGDILTWLNSDDLFHDEQTLAVVATEFEKDPNLDLIYGDYLIIDTLGREIMGKREVGFDYRCLLYAYCYITPAVFFRRSVLDTIGYLNEQFRYIFDWEFYLRSARQGLKIKHLKTYLFRHRFHSDSITVGFQEKQTNEIYALQREYGFTVSPTSILGRSIRKIVDAYYRTKRWLQKVILRRTLVLPFSSHRALKKAAGTGK